MIKRTFEIISCSIFSRFFAWSIFLFCLLYLSEAIIHSGSFPDPPSGELQPVLPYYLLIRCDHLCLFPCFEYPNRWDAFGGWGGRGGSIQASPSMPPLLFLVCQKGTHLSSFQFLWWLLDASPPCLIISNYPKHQCSSPSRLPKAPFFRLENGGWATVLSHTIWVQS